MVEFQAFPKVPRLTRDCVITEKLDGTNASVTIILADRMVDTTNTTAWVVTPAGVHQIFAGSRKRFITPNSEGNKTDNFGFAAWVKENATELVELGPGTHYGEWWGRGIQRNYGLKEKRFSLFNTGRWIDAREAFFPDETREQAPKCCHIVPILYEGVFDTDHIKRTLVALSMSGSNAAPGFYDPEGIMIYHTAARQIFKKTFDGDAQGKGE